MKNKIKKWHIALMSFMALFIAIFASLFSLRADTIDEETGEILTDNWELGIVFYDSTVDNGSTPLTEINWDASDGGYKEGTPRTITVQINYKNNSAVTTYQPGELEISIPNLIYKNNAGTAIDAQWNTSVIVSANDANHSGYDWNFKPYTYSLNGFGYGTSVPNEYGKVYKFTNANTIEEKTNFEGAIQIQYTITPQQEYSIEPKPECVHNYKINIQASLNSFAQSNEIKFNYTRTYIHPWEYAKYTIDKTASKITSLDGLPTGNYYWVKYNFTIKAFNSNGSSKYGSTSVYPNMGSKNQEIRDVFPENCIVLNSSLERLTHINNQYIIPFTFWNEGYSYNKFIYVGYPKEIYNDENNNLNITNHVDLYTKYEDSEEYVFMDDGEVSLNLSDFEFIYSGNLYGITKEYKNATNEYSKEKIYYESLTGQDTAIGNKGITYARLNPTAIYTGNTMNIKYGDDLLYITDINNNYRKLQDNEYYFSVIKFPTRLKNGNNQNIEEGKYNCELWVRYANNNNYIKYDDFTNINAEYGHGIQWDFTKENAVVGYYFIIKEVNESLYFDNAVFNNGYSSITINNATNIAESGYVYNFGFIQVFVDEILQNQPTIDSYANFITQEEIATFDQNTYGSYMQRSYDFISYKKFELETPTYYIKPYKSIGKLTQDVENEIFSGKASISVRNYSKGDKFGSDQEIKNYTYRLSDKNKVQGFEFFDLLPLGMELVSTPDEIKNSIFTSGTYLKVYDKDGNLITNSATGDLLKEHSSVEIIYNYKDTNRTLIHIITNLENDLIMYQTTDWSDPIIMGASYKFKITYDSFLEYGDTYTNGVYIDFYNRTGTDFIKWDTVKDNGSKNEQELDIDNDNNIEEVFSYAQANATINSLISTHQDVTTYVKTNQSNYSTGIVDASCSSEYEYKLRVRTGSADVTNLVIYTSIEEAQPKRTRWYGEFLGIDTSYAENKGYTVKVWYSPNKTVGTLTEDTSWQVYNEATVDKSRVKSLAFQYLAETDDTTGTSINAIEPAVLPANSLTYVLIKMKSPDDESIKTLARMDCWTRWNAIDEFGHPVDFITGINSNVVKVALPNSIKSDDLPSISLKFIKEIQGETTSFENLKLNKADEHIFMIRLTSLTANDDGTYNQVTGLLSSTQGLVITQIPIGTYLLEELGDNYFDFVNFTDNNDSEIIIEGVTFEKTDQGYIITVSEDLAETVEFNIKVTNKTEDESFYEDKEYKENLFLKNKIESGEDPETPI